ncbi:MAG: sigma-70 family RNA polymerase sigma factor [Phycisphaerales bacterium]|nr:MAG: sigma-70 family RNA polymerase sigma factor [Phycisphaerales bacterium]
MLEDTLLKLRFNRGDRDALCRMYEKYKDDLLRLAIALLNDVSLAEDVVNDSFVTFTRSMGELSLRGNLKSFLTTCIVNHARNVHRARQRKTAVGLDQAGQVESGSNGPEQSAIFNEQYQRLQDAMAGLPYEQREIVILHLQHDAKFRQIAKLQNISVNTVKSRYRYGLDKLRTLLNSRLEA